jgi:LEA14-like dessication related protein
MSLKNIYASTIIVFLTIINIGCFQYKEVEVINISDVRIKEISAKAIKVEVAMQIKNPNKYNISIVDADLVIFIKDKKMGIANIKDKIVLPKKSNKIHRFTIQSSIKDISSGAIPLLMGLITKSSIELGVQGDIKAKAKGISKNIPIDIKERVKL